jgi:hypothetical protein
MFKAQAQRLARPSIQASKLPDFTWYMRSGAAMVYAAVGFDQRRGGDRRAQQHDTPSGRRRLLLEMMVEWALQNLDVMDGDADLEPEWREVDADFEPAEP